MDSFEEQVFRTITRYRLLNKGEKVLVALSGGPDSVALLLALLELRGWLEVTVEAAHVNHLLRGREAELDAAFVAESCRSLEVPCTVESVDVGRLAE
ncbi:MAG: tRNA(Ile)-lysidine synthetase, partial [Acidobacteria bacterium]